jgi:hypothetical protein
MPESPSSSFIPKRGPGQKPAAKRAGNFVLLSMVSYALFVSAPLASAAVFIYERHAQNQFNKAVVALDEAIVSFKEEDLERVSAFNDRLTQSKRLLGSHVSVVSLLKTLESATAETVTFKNLDITRTDAATISVAGLLSTPALDGAHFQRSTYSASDIIKSPSFTDVLIVPADPTAPEGASTEKNVEFKATFNFTSADILYKPVTTLNQTETAVTPEVSSSDENEDTEADESLASSTETTL